MIQPVASFTSEEEEEEERELENISESEEEEGTTVRPVNRESIPTSILS